MNNPTGYSLQELKNLSADTSVSPPIPREGMLGKYSDGSYRNILVDENGNIAPALTSLTETLQELISRLAPLAGAMSNTAQGNKIWIKDLSSAGTIKWLYCLQQTVTNLRRIMIY